MPNSPLSALVYLILLIPGIVYVKTTERHRASLKLSTFRETTNIIFASVVSLFVLAFALIAVAAIFPPMGERLSQYLLKPDALFTQDPRRFMAEVLGAVLVTTVLAGIAGVERVQTWAAKALTTETSIKNHWSGWVSAFEDKDMKGYIRLVSLTLKDGSWIQGALYSYSALPEDSGERALVLYGHNSSCAAGAKKVTEIADQFFVIQADQIAKLSVVPLEK